ncbi:MAG: hypothetical protein BGP16_05360 [Sphingobium sp. 66-54]|nr:MAG: hypothetical protein BGP16_05360 [Sphingobium sp. 66-54]
MSLPPYVEAEITRHLDQVAALWKPGTKLTLVVRNESPGAPGDADLVLTNDSLPDVIEAIRIRMAAGQNREALS